MAHVRYLVITPALATASQKPELRHVLHLLTYLLTHSRQVLRAALDRGDEFTIMWDLRNPNPNP